MSGLSKPYCASRAARVSSVMFGLAPAGGGSPGRGRSRRNVTVTANQIVKMPLPRRRRTNRAMDTGGPLAYFAVFEALATDTGFTIDSSSEGFETKPVHLSLCAK